MNPAPAERVPFKDRWPWFAVWVPLLLLFYVVANGGSYMAKIHEGGSLPNILCSNLLDALCGIWGLVFWPVMLSLAYATWRLCPLWGATWLTAQLSILLTLGVLLMMAWLSMPMLSGPVLLSFQGATWGFFWKAPANWQEAENQLVRIWKPHGKGTKSFLTDPNPSIRIRTLYKLMDRPGLITASEIAGLLEDPNPNVQQAAMGCLGQLGDRTYAPAIARLLEDPNPQTYQAAIVVLGQLGDRTYAPAIARFLEDPDAQTRLVAAMALLTFKDPSYVPAFASLLDEKDPHIRLRAIATLIRLGDRSCAPAVAGHLSDPNLQVRLYAISFLSGTGDPVHVPAIARLLEDPDPRIQEGAAEALQKLLKKDWPAPRAAKIQAAQAWWAGRRD